MTYIIAEIGVNHNNNLEYSKKIIDFCSSEKVDAVKFQTFRAETLAQKNTPKVLYQKTNKNDKENHFEMLKKLELSKKDHLILKNYCEKKKIEFISTPYDIESAKFLISLKLKTIKVASADLMDYLLHDFLSKTKKKIILSTGMSNLSNIQDTLKMYKYNNNDKVSLLHCVSNYPCSNSSLNLNSLDTLKKLGYEIGFSDHSRDHLSSALAISKGAKIIEKHITLDNKLPGPDHKSSLNLKDFKQFLNQIKKTNLMLGSYHKSIQKEEKEMLLISRKSPYYRDNYSKGKKIEKNNIIMLRPNTGFKFFDYKKVINKKLKKKVKKNQKISIKDFTY
ncbi:N-acetylneuraminate synthase family protein [Candidatus Pelagibacter sp.]|nr:N-acetylneuraminate synthase family protein [Candidatus Pelagibacter sp.]